MLPAHGYPELKKFKHLAGNYGGAWQEQKKEFHAFSGPVLATTNCIMIPPANSYLDRFYTANVTGLSGAAHIKNRDFSGIIQKAKMLPPLTEAPGKKIMTGFYHTSILGLADKIVAAVKAGKIKRFFLIGGCDGAKPGRNYYTEFAEKVPKDCIILTLACGKYRFNKLDFGTIDGIPRLIDFGQCNNAYSAVQAAVALSKVFNCSVNELPLSFVLSWFEQKAVAILLSLLYLNIRGIRLGPTLPAFVSKNVLNVLVEKFDIKPVTTVDTDLEAALRGQ
jgi:hydroxylamine reductase